MASKPLLRNFIGLNVHTVQFRPELYMPVTRVVRDYHNLDWDIGDDTSYRAKFPMSKNGVDWQQLYGNWKKAGYEIDVCSQFGAIKPDNWKNIPADAFAYGQDTARYFGPSGPHKLITSVEIGNEPGDYPDPIYRAVFENMAKGLRSGDPRLKVVTCATFTTKSGKYWKSLSTFQGLEPLYDVINVHSYAQVEGYPTWRRTFPEDPATPYLKDIRDVIAWRNANARGKEIWLTEFGYDSTTRPNDKTGDFARWRGVTDREQAQYIVRSYLVFSAMAMDRAYLYFFNDADKASVHAAAGLTRNFQPKPSFHAVAHLLKTLGDYRWTRTVEQAASDRCVYEYRHGSDPARRIWAVWSPNGSGRTVPVTLTDVPGRLEKAERMPLAPRRGGTCPL